VFLCDKGCVSAKAFERKERKRVCVSVSVVEREREFVSVFLVEMVASQM
jgi:hypothetical protein